MSNVNLQQLVRALDAASRCDLESAAGRCVARGGNKVLVEDLLLCLLERPRSLLARAAQDAEVDAGTLNAALQPRIENSASRNPVFAPELVQWLQDAVLVANLDLGQTQVDEAALILALLSNPLRYAGSAYQALLGRLSIERLKAFALSGCGLSSTRAPGTAGAPGESLLTRFTHNLTRQARDGQLDPVLCRDEAIRQMVDILARRRKNNPIVVGEAGVGKTALVEGLALRIVAGEVPQAIKGVELLALDMGLLQAGASVKGEFERRLKGVVEEVKAAPGAIILFIDEAHTLIGAGGDAGASDAANLLKPALARGELRTIAATTWTEYKKYFEKDPALSRRFQPVRLQEPTVDEAVTILRGLAPAYERSHGVYLRDDAVVAAAHLSARYLSGRQLPDKAVDVLDTACARVRISLAAAPHSVERLRGDLAEGKRQREALQRDADAGLPIDRQAMDLLETRLRAADDERAALEARWTEQKALAERLLDVRQQMAATRSNAAGEPVLPNNDEGIELDTLPACETQSLESLQVALDEVRRALTQAQAKERLVSVEVCPRLVAEVVSAWTGVPLGQLAREHSANVAGFASDLRARIRGQDPAVHALDRSVRATAAGLNKPDAPAGVFLLVGPSGVGKTETALALADLLYGGERFITTINMSEFQEKHTVSRLIGAPPGYVGYGEGGMLTEAVRRTPYCVVLLDEVEKADPDVLNVFYQIFDKGVVNDGEGREIDFRNTLILMTSNLGSELIIDLCENGARPPAQVLAEAVRPTLVRHFKPALLARMRVVPYYPVGGPVLRELIEIKLNRLGERLNRRQLGFTFSAALVDHLTERCSQSDSGARLIDPLLDDLVLPQVADRLLDAMAVNEGLSSVHATLDAAARVTCEFA
jgi:type VI secretion system protein VasG